MFTRTRRKEKLPYKWRTVIHNDRDGPCGAHPRPWHEGFLEVSTISDVSGEKTTVPFRKRRYANKPVDHLVYKLGSTSAQEQGQLMDKYIKSCPWYGWVEGTVVPPLPFSEEKLKELTVGDPPQLSYSDVLEKLENPFGNNFGETIGEIASIRGLVDEVGTLARAIKQLPTALTSASKRASRNRLKALKDAPQAGLGAYLGVEFGWKQVGEDVAKVIAFAKYSLEHANKLLREMGKPRRVAAVRRYSDVLELTGGVKLKRSFVTRVTYTYVYEYTGSLLSGNSEYLKQLSILHRQMKAFWGLKITPSLMWNLSPASWLIDQFVPVGDILDDIQNWQGPYSSHVQLTFLGGTTSSKCEFTIEYPWSVWANYQLSPQEYWAWNFPTPYPVHRATGTHYVRKVLKGGPGRISFDRSFRPQVSNTGKAYVGLVAISKTRRKLRV